MKTMVSKIPVSVEEYKAWHINSIKNEYSHLRNASKGSTFALQYAGTPHTLVQNAGFSLTEAEQIYKNYHAVYQQSAKFAEEKKIEASKNGYLTIAFGLRLRTPVLKQVMWGSNLMPHEAAAEGRTAGNALSQSYGLLNNRAAVDFMQKVWNSKYRFDILPVALIHDAVYLLIRDNVETVQWANNELIKSMQWQELPEIQHPTVKLGAALDIFWPSWANATTLPNGANKNTIYSICHETKDSQLNKQKELVT